MKKVLTMFGILIFLVGCSEIRTTNDAPYFNFSDEREIRKLMGEVNVGRNTFDGDMVLEKDSSEESNEGDDHSSTNVEYEGVDEGDIMKADERGVFLIEGDSFYFVDSSGEEMKTLSLPSEYHYDELYIKGDTAYILGQYYYHYIWAFSGDDVYTKENALSNESLVVLVEVNLKEWDVVNKTSFSGNKITSRMIDENLYIFTMKHTWDLEKEESILPFTIYDDKKDFVPLNSVYHIENTDTNGFTTFWTYDTQTNEVDSTTVLGLFSNQQISVDKNGIYANQTVYNLEQHSNRDDVVSSDSNLETRGKMLALKFDDVGTPFIFDLIEYKGRVLNQFSIDKYDGFLRFATTEGWGDNVVNRLYIFEEKDDGYEFASLIDEGLGKPRETIRSARFDGETATIVTFEIIDPFYVIDLSDPKNPKITGEVEITGFSTYQHAWGQDEILGFGYETSDEGIINGIKISLFDISDPNNPIEKVKPFIIKMDGWISSEALFNHKALLVMRDENLLGFGLNDWVRDGNTYKNLARYVMFEVSEDEIKMVSEITFEDIYGSENYYGSVRRSMRIGESYFLFSTHGVSVHRVDGEIINVLKFDQSK